MEKMKNKRAQVQIQETILVIFVFTVLLLVGLIIFYRFQVQSIENENFNNELFKFYNMVGYFPNIPELKCSSLTEESECIDVLKMLAFRNTEQNYGYKNITVFVIYPKSTSLKECVKSVDSCNIFKLYYNKPNFQVKNIYKTSTIVSLYYPETDEYRVGKLVLEWYT